MADGAVAGSTSLGPLITEEDMDEEEEEDPLPSAIAGRSRERILGGRRPGLFVKYAWF